MDGISVPSRFACLKIEDEEFHPVSNKSARKKVENNSDKINCKKIIPDKGCIKKSSSKQVRLNSGKNHFL